MIHNEDSRVKIPALLHLTRLGYEYLSLKESKWDESTNIFTDVFNASVHKINPHLSKDDIVRYYNELSLLLENEDLGSFSRKQKDLEAFIRILHDLTGFSKGPRTSSGIRCGL